jgi:hypothetical protein
MMEAICSCETSTIQSTSIRCQHPKAGSTWTTNHNESLKSVNNRCVSMTTNHLKTRVQPSPKSMYIKYTSGNEQCPTQ